MEGSRENNGMFGWTSEGKEGGLVEEKGVCVGHTHRQMRGGEGGKVMKVSDQAVFICVCVCVSFGVHECMDHEHTYTHWTVWVMSVPSQSTAPLLTA